MPANLMKAITVHKYGGVEALQVDNVPQPQLQPDQVLVRNHIAGINFIDIYHRTGLYPLPLPLILGREGAGIITQLGAEVTGLKVGDRVAYVASNSYAEYTAVSQNHALPLTEDISFEEGAAMMIQGLTAIYLVHDSYRVKKGDFVLVPAAAGGTGSLVCQAARAAGAQVIGLVSTSAKAKIALDRGAHHVINYQEQDFVAEVMRLTNGKGVQVVYDGVGEAIYKKCLACLAKRGAFVNFGNASGKITDLESADLTTRCLTFMRPALFYYIETREEFLQYAEKLMALMKEGKMKMDISKVYDFNKVAQAQADLEERRSTGKLLLKFA